MQARPGTLAVRLHMRLGRGNGGLEAAKHFGDGPLAFLKLVAKASPRRQLHVVLDSSTTTKHAKVQAWLASHPRIHPHFTPTDGWWLNLVEVVFSISERPALGGGDLASVGELVAAIGRFCDGPYQRCQPLTWTKDADQSFAKCKRPTALQAADGERPPAADGDGHAPPQAHSGRQAVPPPRPAAAQRRLGGQSQPGTQPRTAAVR
jgi:hypothetical protein